MASNLCGNCKRALDRARTCPSCGWTSPAAQPRAPYSNTAVLLFALGAVVLVISIPFCYGVYQGYSGFNTATAERRELLARRNDRFVSDAQAEQQDRAPAAPSSVPSRSQTRAAGNETELQRGLNAIYREEGPLAQQAQARVYARIDELQLDQALEAKRLTNAADIADGRERLRRYRKLLDELVRLRVEHRAILGQRLRTLAGDLPSGQLVLQGFESAQREISVLETQTDDNRRAMADAFAALLEFAATHQDRMTAQGDQLAFYEQADADAYGRLIGVLASTQEVESALAEQRRAESVKLRDAAAL